jgi:hypothetical protein
MRILPAVFAASLAVAFPGLATGQTARLGAHYGVNLTENHWEQERLGVQGEVRVLGPLVASGAFSQLIDYPGLTGWTGSAWQAHANLRLRARAGWGFASLGYGFVVVHQRLQSPVRPGTIVNIADSEFADTAVLGLEVPTPYVRPFADLYLIYLLDRTGQVGVNLLMGLQVPLPPP